MTVQKKRILFSIIFIIIIIGLGYVWYNVFFGGEDTTPTPIVTGPPLPDNIAFPTAPDGTPLITPDPTIPDLPIASDAPSLPDLDLPDRQSIPVEDTLDQFGSQQLIEEDVNNIGFTTNGNLNFYNQENGKFYTLRNGQIEKLSDEIFYNVQNVTWSPVKNEAILEYPDGSNLYYNFSNDKPITLPVTWEDFSFSESGDKIVAKDMTESPETRWLISASPTGNNIKRIEPLGNNGDKVIVDWSPNNQILALSRTGQPLGADRQEILFVGENKQNFPSTIVEGRDLRTQWSPEGKQLLYSVYNAQNGYRPELWIVDADPANIGSRRRKLGIGTWADKCTFADENNAYCAVPLSLEEGVGLVPELSDTVNDKIYHIDLRSGNRREIPLGENFHTIESLIFDSENNKLYFTDKSAQGLFDVEL